jgi:hypothetical protein
LRVIAEAFYLTTNQLILKSDPSFAGLLKAVEAITGAADEGVSHHATGEG